MKRIVKTKGLERNKRERKMSGSLPILLIMHGYTFFPFLIFIYIFLILVFPMYPIMFGRQEILAYRYTSSRGIEARLLRTNMGHTYRCLKYVSEHINGWKKENTYLIFNPISKYDSLDLKIAHSSMFSLANNYA